MSQKQPNPPPSGERPSPPPKPPKNIEYECGQATSPVDLEFQIMSWNVPKNEREWWAMHKITGLQLKVNSLEQEIARLKTVIEDQENMIDDLRYIDWRD